MTTPATASSVSALRALLTDDMDEFRTRHGQLKGDERRAFAAILTIAFNDEVNGRFGEDHEVSDVIEFVARARTKYVGTGTVTAEDGERVIRAARGEDDQVDAMDAYQFGAAQTAMLLALVRDRNASPEDIDALLQTAEQQARSFFERQARR
jgi:hypothetical protein